MRNDDMDFLWHYLHSRAFERGTAGEAAKTPFVTISRETGTAARALAEALVEALREENEPLLQGWQVFDREVIDGLLADGKTRLSLRGLLCEEDREEVSGLINRLAEGAPAERAIHKETFETVRTIAMLGKAVIVGRAAACYTRDLRQGLQIRLVLPQRLRVSALMRRERLPEAAARRRVEECDRERAELAEACFGRDIGDPTLYDATINGERTSTTAAAALIVSWIKEKAEIFYSYPGR